MAHEAFLSRQARGLRESAIRKMGALLGQVEDVVSFAPGYPSEELFDWDALRAIAAELLSGRDGKALQYGATRETLKAALEEDPGWDVVHLSGHGERGELMLEDERGERDTIGADRIIFGSDYPHAEGLADPRSFVDDLEGFGPDEVRLVMRENALALSQRRPAAA